MGNGGEVWQTSDEGYALGWEGSVHGAAGTSPVWTWYLGGDQVDDAVPPSAQAHRFARSTEPAIPGLTDATAVGPYRRTAWHRDPLTLGAYANYGPGQMTRFGHLMWIEADDPAERQAARAGRIVFAGEHLSDAFPGYMNGGAQTGRLAADAITGRHTRVQAA
jgi:monoamine oxidase